MSIIPNLNYCSECHKPIYGRNGYKKNPLRLLKRYKRVNRLLTQDMKDLLTQKIGPRRHDKYDGYAISEAWVKAAEEYLGIGKPFVRKRRST